MSVMTANGGAVIAIMIAAARKRVLSTLRGGSATTAERARRLDDLDRMARKQLERMVAAGVIRQASPGHFYLDEPAYADWEREQRRRALFIIIAMVFVVLALLFALRA
jgi:hypothetical protein